MRSRCPSCFSMPGFFGNDALGFLMTPFPIATPIVAAHCRLNLSRSAIPRLAWLPAGWLSNALALCRRSAWPRVTGAWLIYAGRVGNLRRGWNVPDAEQPGQLISIHAPSSRSGGDGGNAGHSAAYGAGQTLGRGCEAGFIFSLVAASYSANANMLFLATRLRGCAGIFSFGNSEGTDLPANNGD